MDSLTAFEKIAPYLTHPLVLVGFALLLLFGIHRALIKSGIIPHPEKESDHSMVLAFLRYGFWIALAVIVLGMGLRYSEIQAERDVESSGVSAKGDVNVRAGGGSAATLQTGDGKISIGGTPGEAQAPPAPSPPPAAAVPETANSAIRAGGNVSVEAKEGSTSTLQTGSGSINITNFPSSTIEEIKKLGVTQAALSRFFTILQRRQVAPEDLDSTLREIAKRYKEREEKLAPLPSDTPRLFKLKNEARERLERGSFERIEDLSNWFNLILTKAAWDHWNAEEYDLAIKVAEQCIDQFAPTAKREHRELQNSAPPPPLGEVRDEAEKNRILARGLINDVATCWFIKGRSLEKLERNVDAVDAYCEAATYPYARTYDLSWNGFWSPAQDALDRVEYMGAQCNDR